MRIMTAVVFVGVVALARVAGAQNCDSPASGNTSASAATFVSISASAFTQIHSKPTCPWWSFSCCTEINARVESYTAGMPWTAQVYTHDNAWRATVSWWENLQQTIQGGRGTWLVRSKHWVVTDPGGWYAKDPSEASAFLEGYIEPTGGGNDGPYEDGCEPTPILIDMQGNGYRLTDTAHGVMFDADGDGSPEHTSWTVADGDDAWLAMDRNGNGRIDDGTELFGDHTPAYADPEERHLVARDGFAALGFTEGPGYGTSQTNKLIDSHDAIWSRLVLWTDRNHNGFSEPDELIPVSASTLKGIETTAQESRRVDAFGNEFRLRARAYFARPTRPGIDNPGSGPIDNPRTAPSLIPRFVYDVWLKTRY